MREDLRDLSPKESEAGNIVIVGAGMREPSLPPRCGRRDLRGASC